MPPHHLQSFSHICPPGHRLNHLKRTGGLDMDQQQNKAQEAEAFARVWKRVSPDPDSSPIQCGEVPLAPAADPPPALGAASLKWGEFLRAQILWELTRWRTYQALARAPGSGGGSRLAALALGRAKRMAAVLFLLTGVWYLPREQGHPPQLEDQPGGLPPAVPGGPAGGAPLPRRRPEQSGPGAGRSVPGPGGGVRPGTAPTAPAPVTISRKRTFTVHSQTL